MRSAAFWMRWRDLNPRSSSAAASSDGDIEYSVNHMVAPNCMFIPFHLTADI
jgi:hypothetical protein